MIPHQMKLKSLIVLLFVNVNLLFSQAITGKDEKGVLKPTVYDSTQTLEEQYKPENQYEFIGLQLFLPPVINPEAGPVLFSKQSEDPVKGNKYFTVIDILQGDALAQLKQKNVINQCGYRYKDLSSPLWKEMIIHAVFVLRDNSRKDSANVPPLYWVVSQSKIRPYSNSYFNSFISIPYFEKQKQLFQGQEVIYLSDKSKWLCKDVTLLKSLDTESQDSIYNVFCLLANNKSEQMQLRPPSEKFGRSFITAKEYDRLDHANRNQKEEMIKAENDRKEKRRAECISKFGPHKGPLIAQNKIETGMTTEMCKAAWGAPWDISITKPSSAGKEIWFYNWKYILHFEKGILVKIEH